MLSASRCSFFRQRIRRPPVSSRYSPRYIRLGFRRVLRQFAFGCSGPVLWAMMGDVADYGEWKTGRRATGTVTSAVVFALWIGLALGGAIAGWLLSLYGYQSNAVQTEHALLGIRLIASVTQRGFLPCRGGLPALLRHRHETEPGHLERTGRAAQGILLPGLMTRDTLSPSARSPSPCHSHAGEWNKSHSLKCWRTSYARFKLDTADGLAWACTADCRPSQNFVIDLHRPHRHLLYREFSADPGFASFTHRQPKLVVGEQHGQGIGK